MSLPRPDSSLVTVPLPAEEDLRRVIGISYDSDKTLNVMKMFAGTDDMYPAVVGFIKAVFEAQGVSPKLREMIVLRVATKYHVLYEWQAQSTLARNARLSPQEIQAAASDDAIEGIDADYRLAWKATDEICIEGTLGDETLCQSPDWRDRHAQTDLDHLLVQSAELFHQRLPGAPGSNR
jgi:hypothetical protein